MTMELILESKHAYLHFRDVSILILHWYPKSELEEDKKPFVMHGQASQA